MVLSWRQATWAEILASYDLIIEHLEGKTQAVDRPSRRPEYDIDYENMMARLLATIAATTIDESYDDLPPEINPAQYTDF